MKPRGKDTRQDDITRCNVPSAPWRAEPGSFCRFDGHFSEIIWRDFAWKMNPVQQNPTVEESMPPNTDIFFRDRPKLRNAALLSGKHPIPAHLRLPMSIEQLLSVVRHNVHTLWTQPVSAATS